MQPTVQIQQSEGGGNKAVFWLIIGLVITILLVGAVYWYLSNQQTKQGVSKEPNPIQTETAALQTDLDLIQIPEVGEDFAEIDKDLNSL